MRKLVVACTTLIGGALLVACGGDEDPTPVAVVLTQASGGGALTLSGPDTIESGVVEIRFQNQAQTPASVELIGIEGTHTAREVLDVIENEGAPTPPWFTAGGGVGTTPPGQTATAAIELKEGSYYLISSLSSGDEGGPPATSKAFRVSGEGGGSLPGADTTITAKDYSFEVGDLEAGANEIRFENDGKELHHLQAFPIVQGKSIADVRTAFETEGQPAGPPPVDFRGLVGTATLDTDRAVVTTLTLRPGRYAFVCFVSDRAGGPPHHLKGMLQEVTVAG